MYPVLTTPYVYPSYRELVFNIWTLNQRTIIYSKALMHILTIFMTNNGHDWWSILYNNISVSMNIKVRCKLWNDMELFILKTAYDVWAGVWSFRIYANCVYFVIVATQLAYIRPSDIQIYANLCKLYSNCSLCLQICKNVFLVSFSQVERPKTSHPLYELKATTPCSLHKNMLQFLLISARGRIPCNCVWSNDTRLACLKEMSFTDPSGGLKISEIMMK